MELLIGIGASDFLHKILFTTSDTKFALYGCYTGIKCSCVYHMLKLFLLSANHKGPEKSIQTALRTSGLGHLSMGGGGGGRVVTPNALCSNKVGETKTTYCLRAPKMDQKTF